MNHMASGTNLIDGELIRREQGPPYDLFAQWRAEDPVHWNPVPDDYDNPNPDFRMRDGFWVLTKYQHVYDASRDPALFSSALGGPQLWGFRRGRAGAPARGHHGDGPAAPRPGQAPGHPDLSCRAILAPSSRRSRVSPS